MRPASNVDEISVSDTVLYTRQRSSDGPWSEWIDSGHSGGQTYWSRQINPASINNPVQPDGSRARSAWLNQFSTTSIPWYNALVQADLPWNTSIQFKILGPILPGNSIRLAVGMVSPYCADGTDFPYECEARARTNFLKKLASSTADLGVALAEARQTIDMTRSLAEDILRGIDRAVRAGRGLPKRVVREILYFGKVPAKRPREKSAAYRKRVSRERAVLNKWLETQFGLIPLVNDINEVGQGLSDMLFEQQLPMRMTITSGAKMLIPFQGSEYSPIFASTMIGVFGTAEYKVHISADYDIPLSASRTWNQWGMANPANVLWETTQFSWMVDYAFQVGSWLESLMAATGTIPLGGSMSRVGKMVSLKTRLETSGYYTAISPKDWVAIPVENLGCFQRNLVDAVYPSLRPTIRNKMNLTRLANVLSVLALRKSIT